MSETPSLVASTAAEARGLRREGVRLHKGRRQLQQLLDTYGEGWHDAAAERDRLAAQLDALRERQTTELLQVQVQLNMAIAVRRTAEAQLESTRLESDKLRRGNAVLAEKLDRAERQCAELVHELERLRRDSGLPIALGFNPSDSRRP